MNTKDYKNYSKEEWVGILIKHPELANKCTEHKGWEKFYVIDWHFLLEEQPHLVDFAIKYPIGASVAIGLDSDFAKNCKNWGKFDGSNWANLLIAQPQFSEKCTEYNGWEKFNCVSWSMLLEKQPLFKEKCRC